MVHSQYENGAFSMGIFFVLLAWLCIGSVLAVISGIVLYGITALFVPAAIPDRRRHMQRAFWFPFIMLPYFSIMFIVYAILCYARGVDSGIGDDWLVPLGNGYSLIMIDNPDDGSICLSSDTYRGMKVDGIRKLMQVDSCIVGYAVDPRTQLQPLAMQSGRYFLFNTTSGAATYFATEASLRHAASQQGITSLALQSTENFYFHMRWCWIDLLSVLIVLLLPAYFGIQLLRDVMQLRRQDHSPSTA